MNQFHFWNIFLSFVYMSEFKSVLSYGQIYLGKTNVSFKTGAEIYAQRFKDISRGKWNDFCKQLEYNTKEIILDIWFII